MHGGIEMLLCAEPGMVKASVVLMPRSLLVFSDDAYSKYLHGIDEVRACLSRPP